MSKKKSKELSRRDFLRVSVGAVVATSAGCLGGDPAAGTGGQTGQGGNPVNENLGAGTGGVVTGSGGASPAKSGGAGGRAKGTGGVVTGGTKVKGSGGTGGSAGATGGGGKPLVAMVRGTDWAQAVMDAIDLVGGLPDPGKITGKTVMLRPNVISSTPHPETTNPEVIRGVIRAVKALNPAKIIVAEDGFATASSTSSMQALGITDVCTEEGAETLELKNSETVRQSPEGATSWAGGINFYKAVLDADYVINIPVCKTHFIAIYTMALKAWYGCIPVAGRAHSNFGRLAELRLVKQENFVVLDATKAMVTGGPTGGTSAESKVVVATKDAIAADITGLCIQKQFGPKSGGVYNQKVWNQPQIARALELKLNGWLSSAQNFEYAQQGVTEHADIMAWRDK